MIHLLIIDDEREVGNFLSHLFTEKGYQVTVVNSGKEFYKLDFSKQFHVAMIDLKLPDSDGLTLLRELKNCQPSCSAIVMTGYSTIHTAVEAMKLGASDYIEKPFDDIDLLEEQVEKLLDVRGSAVDPHIQEIAAKIGLVVGENPEMNQLVQTASIIASKNINVLLEGETGTGKEVLARFIHESSGRAREPFIGVNCGALPEALLESELFGHEKGAFTGAISRRRGLFEITSNGTLFLDEVVEASTAIQVKLLRVLETKEFMRVGSETTFRTNTRLVAASNENLQEAVQNKKFREDLYYRLNVVHLKIPPLRERKEDIPLLLEHLVERETNQTITFSDEALKILQEYSWPGNIRELSNFVKRVIAMSDLSKPIMVPANLPFLLELSEPSSSVNSTQDKPTHPVHENKIEKYLNHWVEKTLLAFEKKEEVDLEEVLSEIKEIESTVGKAFIHRTLKATHGNRKETAKRLQISMRKLRYLMNEKSSV